MAKASSASSEETSFTYNLDTHYALPVSQTLGGADPQSPHRITTNAVYDYNTGLVKQATDANGRTSTTDYDPDTLRPIQSTSSTGAYTLFTYDEERMEVTEEVREYSGALAGKSKKYLNGLGQVRKEESHGPTFVDIVETKYNEFAQEWKQSRPYRSGDTVQWSEKFYDLQGRLIRIEEPDGSKTEASYNPAGVPDSATVISPGVLPPGNRILVKDAWGRQRWGRYDQQGRLVEVIEPNPDRGANPDGIILTSTEVAVAGSLNTKYKYDTMDRLVETEQGDQLRKFKYDDLGRLTRQKLAEQTATLNDLGTFVGAGQSGANWSEAFEYDDRSNPMLKVDARGVKVHFSFQINGSDDPLNRLQSIAYDLSGPLEPGLPIHAAPAVNYQYETTGDKLRIGKITTTGLLVEDYSYDVEGRVSNYEQKIVGRETKPLTASYLYDTLDRLREVTYPAQWGLAGPPANPRKIVTHTYDSASRLTQLTYGSDLQASGIVYNAGDQTTSIKIGPNAPNQVTEEYTFDQQTGLLTRQKAIRDKQAQNEQTLLDLSYDYNRNNSIGTGTGKTGHLTKIADNLNNNKNREYEFDALGRLTKAKGGPTGNLWDQTYSFDRYGNRTNIVKNGVAADGSPIPMDGIPNLVYDNANNRITTTGFEYDVAGNQTKGFTEDGTAVKFEYDAANRLHIIKRASDDVYLQAFQFGSTNARLMDTDYQTGFTRMFASVGGTVLAEYHENYATPLAWIKSYVYLGGSQLSTILKDGGNGEYTEYNHSDILGTRTITNPQLGYSYEQVHLPFGTSLNAESTVTSYNKRFTSYDRSVRTGLDYAVNRTYDPKQGRFTQVDPLNIDSSDLNEPQTLNLYTYCGNDPVNHVDAEGLFFGKLFRAIGRFFKKLFTNKWFLLAITVALAVITIGAGIGLWSLAVPVTKSFTIPIFGGLVFTETVMQATVLGWIAAGLTVASAIPSLTSLKGLLSRVASFALGSLSSYFTVSLGMATPDWNPDNHESSFAQTRNLRRSRRRGSGATGPGSWAWGTRVVRRPREPRRVPGRRLPRDPEFSHLKDHQKGHAPWMTPQQYYKSALDNIGTGARVKYHHNGQAKWAYITQVGPNQYVFTSTNLSGTRIFTHMLASRDGGFITGNYLRGLGINPSGIPRHYFRP